MKNDMLQANICQLKLDMITIESSKVKAEKEVAQLKQELERTMSGFAKEKKELELTYQQQVDDMFFSDYQCCMKKHDITNYIHNIPLNEEDEVELDDGVG